MLQKYCYCITFYFFSTWELTCPGPSCFLFFFFFLGGGGGGDEMLLNLFNELS